ncbi:LlaJI family restriction endonuclease [Pseudochrobactrum sp. XF203]|uniref:LlaJI family restriction endonuclease n=1 Tax=Pseudochrobactrum sp. XF203 TaxID=2879116 RepID=UPI001CE2A7FF|nr:LlaJI family restriction endonuclease [Pseudochrobactrum sp. XF203]UCA46997.1 LlaJI family restriction endonuclease [Pseudochrobactrum sp. XF203]
MKLKILHPQIFKDRHSADELKKKHWRLYDYLVRYGAISPDRKRVQFTGLVTLGANETYCFVPRKSLPVSGATISQEIQCAQLTMNVLKKFGTSAQRAAIHYSEGESGIIAPVISELARDYREHGIYSERLKVHGINAGKTNWPATIAKELPYPSGNTAVYIDFRTTKPLRSEDNFLATIQSVIIAEIYDKHFWWLKEEFGNTKRPSPQRVRWHRDQWPQLLRKFMRGLYSARSIHLAKLLIEYLKAENDNPEGSFFCGLRDFHTVWEHMLAKTLAGAEPLWNTKLPKPHYITTTGVAYEASGMRTDIVLRHADRLIVVDAKYYAGTSTQNSPGIPDIIKQIAYKTAIETIEPDVPVETCFVFPTQENHHSTYDRIEFLSSGKKTVPDFPPVHCYYLSINTVMENYLKNKTIKLLKA